MAGAGLVIGGALAVERVAQGRGFHLQTIEGREAGDLGADSIECGRHFAALGFGATVGSSRALVCAVCSASLRSKVWRARRPRRVRMWLRAMPRGGRARI